jgi:long-chain acyl-CoA synthetase
MGKETVSSLTSLKPEEPFNPIPEEHSPLPYSSFPELFFAKIRERERKVAIRHKSLGIWKEVTYRQYGEWIFKVASSLLTMGVKKGDRVGILGENRPEWLYCDHGILSAGGVTVGIYPTSSTEQIRYIATHGGIEILFVENQEQVEKVLPLLPSTGGSFSTETPLRWVVVWDKKGLYGFSHPSVLFWEEFLSRGVSIPPREIQERIRLLRPSDLAFLIYTSGTTGPPKGAMITHKNLLVSARILSQVNELTPNDELLSYLPLSHIYERLLSMILPAYVGYTVNFAESMDTLLQNLREISPTVFGSVPRIWEKIHSQIEIQVENSTFLKRKIYTLAVETGKKYILYKQEGKKPSLFLSFLYFLLNRTVLYNLRRLLGFDRLRYAICGAAPASKELFLYYNALGIPLHEGYGQTESTGVISIHRRGEPRFGTVGPPIPGIEVKIAEDGEILVKGPIVFEGYFNDPELTKETIREGWLHTGDVGKMERGHLIIVDRKKDILITAGGKNITPSYIENQLKFSPYIQDAVVIGEGRKYLVALILIDEDQVTQYAQKNRIPFATFEELATHPLIYKKIGEEVEKVNRNLSQVEKIKKFALIPRRFYEEEGDVTPTRKVKRRAIEKKYSDLIESLYRE